MGQVTPLGMVAKRHVDPIQCVVFFDGTCGLCHGFVRFALARDRQLRLLFAPLQGTTAAHTLPALGRRLEHLDTVYLLTEDQRLLSHSDATLAVLERLGGIWRLAALGQLIPRRVRDALYRCVARLRHGLRAHQACGGVPTVWRNRLLP